MGAAGRCQVRSETATVPCRAPLTCGNVLQQRLYRPARSVRIEVIMGFKSAQLHRKKEHVRGVHRGMR